MTFEKEISQRLGFADVYPCGSRVTCDPAPVDTDQDYLVLVTDENMPNVMNVLTEIGFRWEGSDHYREAAADGFMSWRKGDTNLIVTSNPVWAEKHRLATALCKRLNLLKKDDRIAVFQAVLYAKESAQ